MDPSHDVPEPIGNPTALTWPVYNPYSNIDTTQPGVNLRARTTGSAEDGTPGRRTELLNEGEWRGKSKSKI